MKSIIISLTIAIFTLLGSFTSQAQITPDASVQQALISAMWQSTTVDSQPNPFMLAAIGLVLLIVSICLMGRLKSAIPEFGIAAGLMCFLLIGAFYWGNEIAISKSQKKYEGRAERIASVLANPEVEIASAVQEEKGVSLTLWVKMKISTAEQIILGKTVEVMTVEREAETATLTPLMLANLSPLNLKIAGQPLGEIIAQNNR